MSEPYQGLYLDVQKLVWRSDCKNTYKFWM